MSNTNRNLFKIFYFGVGLLLISIGMSSPLLSQTAIGSASLNGTVTDPSGAAVPNAKVTVTNTATGLTLTTQASEVGLYAIGGLPVGTYDLTADATGFKTTKRTAIPLQVGAVATIDVRLEIGNLQETVSVLAASVRAARQHRDYRRPRERWQQL